MRLSSIQRASLMGAMLVPVLCQTAEAHTGVGATTGFASGFLHPLTGLDHMLAMFAVGLFAAQLGGRALWLVPAAFLSMMALGGLLGMAGGSLPFVEAGIGLSVVVLGLAVALHLPLPLAAAALLAGLFAIFHGHAHGTEMPVLASGLAYGAGFIAATALLHATGIALGVLTAGRGHALRIGGSAIALAGAGILAGLV